MVEGNKKGMRVRRETGAAEEGRGGGGREEGRKEKREEEGEGEAERWTRLTF